jgi:putative hydrolase of the HAD superfamily
MKRTAPITTLFLDIGGVLLTNGWDHHARRRAAKHFKLEWSEMEERHALNFETHEEGRLAFKDYLDRVVFYQKRPFTRAQFRNFMCGQSKPYTEMLTLVMRLKARYDLNITVVSNEARELNAYRIQEFKLDRFVDAFISSCFVQLRKPDVAIFRLALDISMAPTREIVYIENTPLFVQIAEGLGIRSILHTDYRTTCAKLAALGLQHHETDDLIPFERLVGLHPIANLPPLAQREFGTVPMAIKPISDARTQFRRIARKTSATP